ncbi:unnamed protein product, partial [Chrysoparadoxa australica]
MAEFRAWQAEKVKEKKEEIAARREAGLPVPAPPTAAELVKIKKREQRAQADAKDEKELLEKLGVAGVANQFWANEGSTKVSQIAESSHKAVSVEKPAKAHASQVRPEASAQSHTESLPGSNTV